VYYLKLEKGNACTNYRIFTQDLRAAVRKEFGIGENIKFSLQRVLGDDEEETAAIHKSQWLTIILQLIKENPHCKIFVKIFS
jgi:hypothetical protein